MKKLMREAWCVLVVLSCCPAFSQAATTETTSIPFIGCKSDGQLGPEDAPTGKSLESSIPAIAAQRLAYYKDARSEVGVLAPRGWYCFGTYGSSGDALYVSPAPINADDVLSAEWKGFSGPVIEISCEYGGTSGRYAVAKVIARVFPSHIDFVKHVEAGDKRIRGAVTSFAFGPYKDDVLTYRAKDIVEFRTPANAEGLGTDSRLIRNGSSIRGVVILVGYDPDLIHLSVRLPFGESDLTKFIVGQSEREAMHLNAGLE